MKRTILFLLAAAALLASCAPAATPAPTVAPVRNDRFIIDPRTGSTAPADPQLARRFDAAWRSAVSGDEALARTRLAEILRTHPDYAPATLALAAIDIRAERWNEAESAVQQVLAVDRNNLPARIYAAEIAYRQRQTRRAYDLYRNLAAAPDAPEFARERLTELETNLFSELYTAAQSATPEESIRLLREALLINAGATEARILLTQRLVAQRQWEEARRALDPILSGPDVDRSEVQEALAEIDAGRGRYQEAIVRYDRLSRRTKEPRYATRLEEIKEEWSAQNMPSHFRQALESDALTRAELAVLLYWKVPSVRFAQNVSAPPIAIDISEVAGREEIIRAIALGLFEVDPVTRRVGPHRQMTSDRLARFLTRVLQVRGAACARSIPGDRVLSACGVTDPAAGDPNAPVSGRTASRMLEQVAKALQ
ncbi:MAG TPA: tetratricopeptide repeat protein [Thermoanaerobaculia bacterium]|jgi:hypothetical protein